MNVTVKESTIVRPAKPTPNHTLWLSRLDMIARMPYSHSPLAYIYGPSKNFDPQILKNSLSQVLVPFYPVAGRLNQNPQTKRFEIDCNGAGVLFKSVETTHCLADFEGFKPTPEFRNLVMPKCDYSKGLSSFPLLLVQVTRFKCGGVCIGFGVHHHLADGIGHVFFINSWARLARGVRLDVHPVFDRRVYFSPREPARVVFQHLEYGPDLPALPVQGCSGEMGTGQERLFKLSKAQINALKLEASTSQPHEQPYKLTTYEVLAGHVWRSVCKARGLTGDQYVKLYIPTDIRPRLRDPPLPEGYFGNAILFMACVAKACDVTKQPLHNVAYKVHETLKKLDNKEYLKSSIDYLESQPDLAKIVRGSHSVTCPNLSINSWGKIPFYEADFGWGKPKFIGHGGIRWEGQSFFVPSPNNDGSFSLSINLSALHMRYFEHYLYDIKSFSSL